MVDKSYTNKKKGGSSVSAAEARSSGAKKSLSSDFKNAGIENTSSKKQFGGIKRKGE